MGPWESTSTNEHPVRCTGMNRSLVHERARASTSILCAAQVGIAHVSMGEHEHPRASTSMLCAEQAGIAHVPMAEHEHPRASTTILSAAQVGVAHGPMGQHGHPRASTSMLCALHRWEPPIGPWESTSTHERPVCCTCRNRSWVHGRPRASTSILCAAQVGTAHGPMAEHPLHEHPRASCALHR